MKKIIKLLILILLSLSVYFIYQQTNHKTITIMSIGDGLSLGINSYGIQEYSYLNYYKDSIKDKNVLLSNTFSNKELTVKEVLEKVKNNSTIKRDLREANLLILNIGYNDLLYQLSLIDTINQSKYNEIIKNIVKDYESLLKEINRYYKEDIIVLGLYQSNKEDIYLNRGIRDLNKYLIRNNKITYIDTDKILNNRKKFFSSPHSNYPNHYGYQAIANKIIEKTLEK